MFPCPVCDVKLNSAEQLRAHCRGKNHIKREEARKKAEELGTDFDSTPDHCDVCNVPLTSKMTAIDHFKGKLHQKKVKAVEEQRQGFKNYCDICEVRLQSLKVSEAHFNGKQHQKRERKTNSVKGRGKKIATERKCNSSRTSRSRSEEFSPTPNIFGVVFEETPVNSSSWENVSVENESEANDILGEFRNSLNGKSLDSPNTPHSSSPESPTEPFFSFDNPVLSNTSAFISPTDNLLHETTIPGRSPPVVEASLPSGLTPYFNNDDLLLECTPLESTLETQESFEHLNRTYNSTLSSLNGAQCISAQNEYLVQTKAVVSVLRGACHGISSGDIATKIAGLSPSEVNLILSDLEQHDLVLKSGYAPILWSLVGNTAPLSPSKQPSKQPYKTLNGFSHPKKESMASTKEAQYFETTRDSYFNQDGQNHFSLNEACIPLTEAILISPLTSATTTTAPGQGVRPYAQVIEPTYTTMAEPSDIVRLHANVIESNLLNMLQQSGSLTMHEIKTKLNFRDDSRLVFILQKLLERNVIVKDGGIRWRLASSSRTNVGVIGEERKRRSPVESEKSMGRVTINIHRGQNGYHSSALNPVSPSNRRVQNGFNISPNDSGNSAKVQKGFHVSPNHSGNSAKVQTGFHVSPNQSGNCTRVQTGFHVSPNQSGNCTRVQTGFHVSPNQSGNCTRVQTGFHVSPNESINCTKVQNGFHKPETFLQHNGYMESDKHNGFWINNDGGKVVQNSRNNSKQYNRSSPPLALKTETSEVLEDLTLTTPKAHQKELYEKAMLEDTVCYLPCGTGKRLVMAQVIAHMALLNPTKQSLVIVPDIVTALDVAHVLRNELVSKNKKLNVALYARQLKQCNGKAQVVVVTSSTCLGLLNCAALLWKDVCLMVFDLAVMCCYDEPSKKILHQYYLKAKIDYGEGYVPKLLSFLDSSAGQENLQETMRIFGDILTTMGDVFLSSVSKSLVELQDCKREAMFVYVQTSLSEEESRMLFLLETYLKLVFDNLAAQWQPLNTHRELLKISFNQSSVVSEAFVKLIYLTSQFPERRLPQSCLKTWRHYLAICEVIFSLVECGEDLAMELLLNLTREQFGFAWADDVGLPGLELSRQLMKNEISNFGCSVSNPRGSGLRELLDQLMIMQWENARVASERPLALIIVKLSKTAKILANYLARCPQLVKRNVKTTFVDGSRSHQQKAVISAIKRRQYQVIVSTDNIDNELPHCELVILLDQHTSVYTLQQLRTRRATNVVAISPDDGGEEKLKELLRKEELVEKAISLMR